MRIFAGPNGSGKSTLFQQFSKNYNAGYFVNADLLESQLRETGLIDLKAIGLIVNQTDLDEFEQSNIAKSILKKAISENCLISDKTLGNLYPALQIANRAYLFDNSGDRLVLIAELSEGELELKVSSLPDWFYEYVLPNYTQPSS